MNVVFDEATARNIREVTQEGMTYIAFAGEEVGFVVAFPKSVVQWNEQAQAYILMADRDKLNGFIEKLQESLDRGVM